MTMSIRWDSDGFLIPPAKVPGTSVEINESWGKIIRRDESNDLWWTWQPDPDDEGLFELVISTYKGFAEEELVKVAEYVGW